MMSNLKIYIKYFSQTGQNGQNGQNDKNNLMILQDQPKEGNPTNGEYYKIMVNSINNFIPEVRIYLEKNPKLSLLDLNEVEVNFQIQNLQGSGKNLNNNIWDQPHANSVIQDNV